LSDVEDIATMEISIGRHTIIVTEKRAFLVSKNIFDLIQPPGIEIAFMPFGIGILCGIKSAQWMAHISYEIV